MTKRIEKITLNRFRGATATTEVTFDPNKAVVIVFGENGSGKSSIADAIDFVFNQASGSLGDRSSTRPKDHLPAIGHSAKEIKVEIVYGGRTWTGKFTGAKIQVNEQSNLPADLPVAHVLRRSRLLNLIEASPAERYKQLQNFIDVEAVEHSEQALRDAVREQARTLDEKSRAKIEAERELEKFWIDEGSPGAPDQDARNWAEARTSVDLDEARAEREGSNKLIGLIDRAAQAQDSFRRAETDALQKKARVAEAQRDLSISSGAGAPDALRLVELLRDARGYLTTSPDAPACPVCEQPVSAEDLSRRIDDRLNAMTELGALRDRIETANKEQQNTAAILERDRMRMLDSARSFADALKDSGDGQLSSLAASPVDAVNLPGLIEKAVKIRDALVIRRDEAQKAINQYNSINQFYCRIIECEAELLESETLRRGLEHALQIVQGKRIEFTQSVLAKVCSETNRLYALIHPDEPLGLDALLLDEKRKSSLLQVCNFEGHNDVVPQAYFSDSHLDTLGFSLWLAIAKQSSEGDTVVVLDDIFNSVDDSHLTRILDLLVGESEYFNQVIITTHNPQWRDRYAGRQIPYNKIHFLELHRWTRDEGIRSAERSAIKTDADPR